MQPRISLEKKSTDDQPSNGKKSVKHSNQVSFFKPDQESKITINNILNKEYFDTHSCLFECFTWVKTIKITEEEERLYTDKFDDHGMRLRPLMPCVIFSVLDDSHIEFQIKIDKDSLIKAFSNPEYNRDGSRRISVYKRVFNEDYIEDICTEDRLCPTFQRAINMTFLNDNLKKIAISTYHHNELTGDSMILKIAGII